MKTKTIYFKIILGSSIQNTKTENVLLLIGRRVWQVLNSFMRYLQNLKKIKWIKILFFSNIPKTKIFNQYLLHAR